MDIKHTIASKATMYCNDRTEDCGMKPAPQGDV